MLDIWNSRWGHIFKSGILINCIPNSHTHRGRRGKMWFGRVPDINGFLFGRRPLALSQYYSLNFAILNLGKTLD